MSFVYEELNKQIGQDRTSSTIQGREPNYASPAKHSQAKSNLAQPQR